MKTFTFSLLLLLCCNLALSQANTGNGPITQNVYGAITSDTTNLFMRIRDTTDIHLPGYTTRSMWKAAVDSLALLRGKLDTMTTNADTVSRTPRSHATLTQLDTKVAKGDTTGQTPASYVTQTQHALKANAASPVFTGTMTGSATMRGTKTFAYAAKEDTLVVSGFASGDHLLLTPLINSAGDTTGFKALWVRRMTTDTAFVMQTTSAAYAAIIAGAVLLARFSGEGIAEGLPGPG